MPVIKKILLVAVSNYTLPKGTDIVLDGKGHMPLGILSIAAYLKENTKIPIICIDQRIDDPVVFIKKEFNELLFVGLSAMSANYAAAKDILKKVKLNYPDLPCVIGGPHPSAAGQEVVRDGFDVAVIGEGEIICGEISDIFQNFEQKEQRIEALSKVQSIAFKDQNDQIVINSRKEFVNDLDTLPFLDRSFLPARNYSKTNITMSTSRGCPGRCIFCQSGPNLFGQKIRQQSVKHTLMEIKTLLKAGGSFITFLDDCLLWNEKWVHEFCDAIKEEDLRFNWVCETRAQFITESIIRKIIEAGCRGVNIGFESGSDNTLQFLRKGTNVAMYKKCVDVLHRYGLQFHSYIIIGAPHETKEDLEKTVQFVRESRPTQLAVSRLTPIYGCELFDYLTERNLVSDVGEQVFYENLFPIKCEHLTQEDLDNYEVEIYKAMYLPGKLPREPKGSAALFDDPIPSYSVTSKCFRSTLRVKNNTNFNWIAYPSPILVPLEELKTKKLRDNFYQQIEGKRIELYLDWYDANHKLIRRDCAGHLVGNVPIGQYGTFVFEYTIPDKLAEVYFEYNLILPDDRKSLIELSYKPFRRLIRFESKNSHNPVLSVRSFLKRRDSSYWIRRSVVAFLKIAKKTTGL